MPCRRWMPARHSGGLREAAEVNGKTVPDPGLLGVVPDGIHGEIDLPAVRSRSSFLQGKVNSPLFLRMRQAAFAAPGNRLEISGTVRPAQVDPDHIEPMKTSDVLTPCAARYRRQVGHFLLGRAILALRNSLPYLKMENLIRAEIRRCGDLTNRLNSEKPRLRRALSPFPGYPKLGQTQRLGSSRIVRVPEV